MNDENKNESASKKKLKLVKDDSLERELNSSLTQAIHQKYGTVEDIDKLRKRRKKDRMMRALVAASILFVVSIIALLWLKKAHFVPRDNVEIYKELVTAIGNFSIHPNRDDNLQDMAKVLTKLSGSANVSEETLGIGYAVFSIQEIDAGFLDIGIADCRRTIKRFPDSPCADSLKKIVDGIECPNCEGKGFILEKCDACNGTGRCPKCKGKGSVATLSGQPLKCTSCDGRGECSKCMGTGKIEVECSRCEGKGRIFDQTIFNRESTKIMTRAVSDSAFHHTKAEVLEALHKVQQKIKSPGNDQ